MLVPSNAARRSHTVEDARRLRPDKSGLTPRFLSLWWYCRRENASCLRTARFTGTSFPSA